MIFVVKAYLGFSLDFFWLQRNSAFETSIKFTTFVYKFLVDIKNVKILNIDPKY